MQTVKELIVLIKNAPYNFSGIEGYIVSKDVLSKLEFVLAMISESEQSNWQKQYNEENMVKFATWFNETQGKGETDDKTKMLFTKYDYKRIVNEWLAQYKDVDK